MRRAAVGETYSLVIERHQGNPVLYAEDHITVLEHQLQMVHSKTIIKFLPPQSGLYFVDVVDGSSQHSIPIVAVDIIYVSGYVGEELKIKIPFHKKREAKSLVVNALGSCKGCSYEITDTDQSEYELRFSGTHRGTFRLDVLSELQIDDNSLSFLDTLPLVSVIVRLSYGICVQHQTKEGIVGFPFIWSFSCEEEVWRRLEKFKVEVTTPTGEEREVDVFTHPDGTRKGIFTPDVAGLYVGCITFNYFKKNSITMQTELLEVMVQPLLEEPCSYSTKLNLSQSAPSQRKNLYALTQPMIYLSPKQSSSTEVDSDVDSSESSSSQVGRRANKPMNVSKSSDNSPTVLKNSELLKLSRKAVVSEKNSSRSLVLKAPASPIQEDPKFSLGFTSISTTAYEFDLDIAVPIAIDVIREFLEKNKADPRIHLYLLDIEESVALHKYREEAYKSLPPTETRLTIQQADITKLKSSGIPCWYISNASNPRFSGGGSGVNRSIHAACKSPTQSLSKLTRRVYKDEAETGKAYPVQLPPDSPLRKGQDVQMVIHVVGPNMNPNRARCLKGDYEKGSMLLRQTYKNLLDCFYHQAATWKSSELIDDLRFPSGHSF